MISHATQYYDLCVFTPETHRVLSQHTTQHVYRCGRQCFDKKTQYMDTYFRVCVCVQL